MKSNIININKNIESPKPLQYYFLFDKNKNCYVGSISIRKSELGSKLVVDYSTRENTVPMQISLVNALTSYLNSDFIIKTGE